MNKTLITWLEKNSPQIAVGLTVLGAILRLLGLGARPLWFDEAISAVYAKQDLATLFRLNAGDNHPPGYYVGLKFWIDLFGSSETVLRLFSVLPGVAAIWLVWLVGRRLFPGNLPVALGATAFTALSPFQIYFSQEVRNYAILELAVLLAIWFWLRALENNAWANWAGLALAGTLGLVCNFTTAFYLAALGLFLFFGWRKNWQKGLIGRLLVAGAATSVLSGLFLLPKLTGRLETIKGNFWIPAPDVLVVLRTFYTFIFGAVESDRFVVAFLLALVLFILVLAQIIPAILPNKTKEPAVAESENRQAVQLTAWLLVGPMLLIIIVSWLFQPLYLDKALIACSPFYYLLLSWTIFRNDRKRQGGWILTGIPAALSLLLALTVLPNLYSGVVNPLYIARYDAPRITQYLKEQAQPGDIVLTATDISWLPLVYYNSNFAPAKYALKEYPYPNIFPDLIKTLGSEWYSQEKVLQNNGRVWVIFEVNAPENTLKDSPRPAQLSSEPNWLHSPDWQRDTLAWFDKNLRRVRTENLDRLLLVLYERK